MERIDLSTCTDDIVEIILPGGARLVYTPPHALQPAYLTTQQLSTLFEQFHAEQRAYTDKRAGTLTNYRQSFRQFHRWLMVQHTETVTPAHWRQYYTHLRTRKLSVHTVRNHYRDLSVFARWLIEHNHIADNPLAGITLPDLPKDTPPKAISDDDILLMVDAARTQRDKTLLLFFLDTGCRIGEAVALRWEDIDFSTSTARVVDGKHHRARYLFLSKPVLALLRAYRDTVPGAPENNVWRGKKGSLTNSGVYQIFRRIAKRAGVSGNVNPHAWRHAFGKHATVDGMPTGVLQKLLGHSSIETTQVYLNLDVSALRDAHNRHTPAKLIIDQNAEND